MIIYYSSHHTDRTIVNESEGEAQDEMRMEKFIYYEIELNESIININTTIITDHYYYPLFSCTEDYYLPYNTTEIEENNISLENYPYCLDKRSVLNEIETTQRAINHFKENVMMELLQNALHPDRLKWIF
jgi:hypothetical protein